MTENEVVEAYRNHLSLHTRRIRLESADTLETNEQQDERLAAYTAWLDAELKYLGELP